MRKKGWADVAKFILEESGRPLSAQEIAQWAYKEGLKRDLSQAPEYSVQAAIMRDIAAKGDDSCFDYDDSRKHRLFRLKTNINTAQ
jgi:hypothetical protein